MLLCEAINNHDNTNYESATACTQVTLVDNELHDSRQFLGSCVNFSDLIDCHEDVATLSN